MSKITKVREKVATIREQERAFQALMVNEDYDNPQVETLERLMARGWSDLGCYAPHLLDAVDEARAVVAALVGNWNAWTHEDDEGLYCAHCKSRAALVVENIDMAVKCDHAPDCPVARGLAMVARE